VGWVLLALGGSFGVAGILATARDRMMIPVLIWGMYVSLGLLVTLGPWVWELGEDYPVKPVAELVRRHTPTGIGIYTTHSVTRPSLDFYADRRVSRLEESKTPDLFLKSEAQPYLLVRDYEVATIRGKVVARVKGWAIMTRRD
jgi:4-amino-4-deoxy-L-arabinose transferase-like glycosyltransferase